MFSNRGLCVCEGMEAYVFVRAWEREGNYCTAWVLCQDCNSTEKSDPFDSVQRRKFVSPKKRKRNAATAF